MNRWSHIDRAKSIKVKKKVFKGGSMEVSHPNHFRKLWQTHQPNNLLTNQLRQTIGQEGSRWEITLPIILSSFWTHVHINICMYLLTNHLLPEPDIFRAILLLKIRNKVLSWERIEIFYHYISEHWVLSPVWQYHSWVDRAAAAHPHGSG